MRSPRAERVQQLGHGIVALTPLRQKNLEWRVGPGWVYLRNGGLSISNRRRGLEVVAFYINNDIPVALRACGNATYSAVHWVIVQVFASRVKLLLVILVGHTFSEFRGFRSRPRVRIAFLSRLER